jgi:hypothetical protein
VKKKVYLVEEGVEVVLVGRVVGEKYFVYVCGVPNEEHDTWLAKLHFLTVWSNKNPDGHVCIETNELEHE